MNNLDQFILNADDFIYDNTENYTVILNDSMYYLDAEKLELYNNHNRIEISKEIKDYIIEKCLEDIPF